MIANPDKLPAIFLSKIDNSVSHKLNIYDDNTETTKSVKLLGVLIKKKGTSTMKIKRLRVLTTKIFKKLNDIKPKLHEKYIYL